MERIYRLFIQKPVIRKIIISFLVPYFCENIIDWSTCLFHDSASEGIFFLGLSVFFKKVFNVEFSTGYIFSLNRTKLWSVNVF